MPHHREVHQNANKTMNKPGREGAAADRVSAEGDGAERGECADGDELPALLQEQAPKAASLPRDVLTWAALVVSSLAAGWLLELRGFPAAFFVGPMACAVLFGLCGARLAPPRQLFLAAQALIGCAVAESITGAILATILTHWAAMSLTVASTVLAGGLVGWMLVKARVLPGTTAALGSIPGGASAMVAMAEACGADARLVALMHYLRILLVVLTASVAAHLLSSGGLPASPAIAPALTLTLAGGSAREALLSTLALALGGGYLGYRLRLPAGVLLVPMVLGGALHAADLTSFPQPFWLKAAAAISIGWYVGLGFNRKILVFALRLLPRILLSTLLLIALCAASASLLVLVVHTDPLTAYLATSPGGLDSIVLIAMGGQADVAFVVAVQTLRLFAVILCGPAIARLVSRQALARGL